MARHEQERTYFDFWTPQTRRGRNVVGWVLFAIGVLAFIKGYIDQDSISRDFGADDPVRILLVILFLYVGVNVAAWYLVICIGRFVYHRLANTELLTSRIQASKETAELKALRRRSEIKRLREELGDDARKEKEENP